MTLGERLVFYRNQAGYNQKQLAEKLNILPTRLNYWEKDKREPDVEMIKALAEALNVSSDKLLDIKNESPAPEGTEDSEQVISMEMSDRLFGILMEAGLIHEGNSFTDDDRAFLNHIIGLLDVWIRSKRT